MLQEAMALFFEGCCEEGIVDRVLEESGLEVRITANAADHAAPQDTVSVPVNMVPDAQVVAGWPAEPRFSPPVSTTTPFSRARPMSTYPLLWE